MHDLTKDLDAEWYDHTKLSLYRLCPQKYKYRVCEQLIPTEPEYALAFGIAIHKALETIYNNTYAERIQTDNGQIIYNYQDVFLSNYPQDAPKGARTRAIGVELLTHYIAKWREEPFKVIEIEVPFAMPIKDVHNKPDFYLVGRIDLVINWNDEVMPLDHKTTSYFGEHFELGFKVDTQPTIYMMALGANKAVINALRVSAKINDESFVRKVTTRTPEEFARALSDIRTTVQNIRTSYERDSWPRHGSQSCFAYNRTCEYYALCASSDQQAETLKETSFARNTWQPV